MVFSLVNSLCSHLVALLTWCFDRFVAPSLIPIVHMGIIPDFLIRKAVQWMLHDRLVSCDQNSVDKNMEAKMQYIKELQKLPVAINTQSANSQHYELPPELYEHVLGRNKKYSCCLWEAPSATLDDSEEAALNQVATRADVRERHSVLDLGCGWGSFTLWAAQKFPYAEFTCVSNSASQRDYIRAQASKKGLKNITAIHADVNDYKPKEDGSFDRVVSIEMFEHVKNYGELLQRISRWLKPSGKLFVHIFSHKEFPYHFTEGWMAENFFTGGQMPSDDLLLYFQGHLRMANHWRVSGRHYAKTCNEWLKRLDANKHRVLPVLQKAYRCRNASEAYERFIDWRLFYIACAELFAYHDGNEWFVSHYLLEKR
eukprot:gb/GECG01009035.1/.p1 GENE.gb/GECG01009035.1/~~gb/GECG01009035.1/.p1  ORF type:complete len:370 (+),score=36.16 gb/GECG01009035.1/:1-1110(+)